MHISMIYFGNHFLNSGLGWGLCGLRPARFVDTGRIDNLGLALANRIILCSWCLHLLAVHLAKLIRGQELPDEVFNSEELTLQRVDFIQLSLEAVGIDLLKTFYLLFIKASLSHKGRRLGDSLYSWLLLLLFSRHHGENNREIVKSLWLDSFWIYSSSTKHAIWETIVRRPELGWKAQPRWVVSQTSVSCFTWVIPKSIVKLANQGLLFAV